MIGYIEKCQICEHSPLTMVLNLGHHTPVHVRITKELLHQPETTYPLNLVLCENCGLSQLDYIGDPKVIFPLEYPYQTGMTNMLIRNFKQLADELEPKYGLKPNDLIVDIGSNDGTLLQPFKDKGMRVLGIEPTNVAQIANKNGITTIQEYFTKDTAERAVKEYGKAKVVTLTNAFAHIFNLYEIIDGIKVILDDDGIFVSESQYLVDAIEKNAYDTIYHEHIRFYTLTALQELFKRTGFSIVDAERITAAGGSIRVFAKIGESDMSDRAKEILENEKNIGACTPKTLHEFAKKAINAKYGLNNLLSGLKLNGASIVTIGAPARGNSMLNFVKIDTDLIDYACEKAGSPKIGLFTPGTHIPIVDEKKLFDEQPDYALMLSWHIGDELMKKLRELGYKGKFILPLPEPRIVKEI
ncbi:MAG: class I SAM-dependent methyltransferase [bacterium]|nr:class I SAM-dependent methyltransferase [bacterium]